MAKTRWHRVDAIFAGALTLPPAERPDYVNRACGEDPALRAEVEELLEAADAADHYFEARQPSPHLIDRAIQEAPAFGEGHRIGPYRVVRLLGQGGMGAVYLGERADGQFEQRVAIKLVHPARVRGSDLIERFLRERQILARLEHPSIARLHDGGVTDDGWPYLAMEYVDGVPIDVFCDSRRLTVEQRIELLQEVGRAVHYAHQNLIIHRDLKPSNLLVTADGTVKLLDFGIAKLLEEGEETTVTHTATGLMTPAYAAPEQVRRTGVTTATDVYALGVLLYELLAGRRPHAHLESTPIEMAAAVEQTVPDPPSGALSATGRDAPETIATIASARSTEPARLRRRLTGDLDRICLMALRKEPERRYVSAQALVDDLSRHLDGHTVIARPDTFGYRTRKFIARNRTAVAAAALVIVSLVTGLGAALWQRDIARNEAVKAREVTDFVLGLFEVSDPGQASDEEITVRDLLDRGAARIENELAGQPPLQAEMFSLIGGIHARLGSFDAGRDMLQRAVELQRSTAGRGSVRHALATHELGRLEHDAGNTELADSLYRVAQAWLVQVRGRQSAETGWIERDRADLAASLGRYDEADSLFAAARTRLAAAGVAASQLLLLDLDYLELLHMRGDTEREDSLYARILADREHLASDRLITVAKGMMELGIQATYRGDLGRAESLVEGAVELRRQAYGETHADIASGLCHLAEVQWASGRRDEGFDTNRQCVQMLRETLGGEHPEYAMRLGALGVKLNWRGDVTDAVRTFEEVERIQVAALGDEHFHTAATRRNLARSLMSLGRHEDALPKLEAALSGWIAAMGDQDFFTGPTRMDMALTLAELGQTARADSMAESVLARYRENPPTGTALGEALVAHARLRAAAGNFEEAAGIARAALAEYDEKDIPDEHVYRATAESDLGRYLIRLGDLASAEEHLLHALRAFETQRGPSSELAITARERLNELYRAWDRPDDAARFAVDRR